MADPITESVFTKKTSTLFFAKTLPPLPPGHYLNKNGVPSYVIEVVAKYYQKVESDYRYLRKHNETAEANINTVESLRAIPIIDVRPDSSVKYLGFKFYDDSSDKEVGFAWFNSAGNKLAYIGRVGHAGNLIFVPNAVGSSYKYFLLKDNGNFEYKTSGEIGSEVDNSGNISGYPPFPSDSEFLLGAYGVKNQGDELVGDYTFKPDSQGNGKFEFFRKYVDNSLKRVVTIFFNNKGIPVDPDNDRVGIRLENSHVIQAAGQPIDNDSLVNLGYLISYLTANYTTITERNRLINSFTEYDAIVKSADATGYKEYSSVRAALLAGAKKIRVMSGNYSATNFWPIFTDSFTATSEISIDGDPRGESIIEGNSVFWKPGLIANNVKIKNLTFKADSGTVFQIAATTYNLLIENCNFTELNTEPSVGLDLSGAFEDAVVTVNNCKFHSLATCLYTPNGNSLSRQIIKNVKIYDSLFYNFDTGLSWGAEGCFHLENSRFIIERTNSIAINILPYESTSSTSATKITKHTILSNIFDIVANTSICIKITVNGTAARNGSRLLISNNIFKTSSGASTPKSIYISANTALSGNKFYLVIINNEFYNFSINSSTGIDVEGVSGATTIDSALIMSGFTQITAEDDLDDLQKSNIIV